MNATKESMKYSHPSKAYSTEEWVNMAKMKYPNMLYDRVVYINKDTPVEIGLLTVK